MYCASCGTAATPGMSYCSRCGIELNAPPANPMKVSATLPESLIWAIVGVSVLGIGVIIGLMAVMKESLHFNDGLIAAFTSFSFLMIMAAESVFIWMLLRSRSGAKAADQFTQQPRATMRELDGAPVRGLPEPALSVTEHTTRTLESSPSERNIE